jgi:hypothetical protein
MHSLRRLTLALAVALALSSTAGAAVYYVDQNNPSASDSNAGTNEALPTKTIGKVCPGLHAGDTVYVMAGTYNERIGFNSGVTGTAASKITFKALPPHSVQMYGFDTTNCNYVHIEGFSITHSPSATGTSATGVVIASSNVEVVNNWFPNNQFYGIWSGSFYYSWDNYTKADDALIQFNKFTHCKSGIFVSGRRWIADRNEVTQLFEYGGTTDCDYSRVFGINNVIRGNFFHNTAPADIGAGTSHAAHVDGVQTYSDNGDYGTNIVVVNNVILDCGEGFMGEGFLGDGVTVQPLMTNWFFRGNIVSSTPGVNYPSAWGFNSYGVPFCTVTHNTVYDIQYYGAGIRNTHDGFVNSNIFSKLTDRAYYSQNTTNFVGDYNLTFQAGTPSPVGVHDKINVDPLFVSVGLTARNFHLRAGSPAIHGAADGSDLGALEYPAVYYVDQQHPGASADYFGYYGAPFKTINQACAVAQSGETIMIRAGTYRETVVATQPNVTFQAYSGEPAVISGADEIAGWTRSGSTWYASMATAPTQVLKDGVPFTGFTYDPATQRLTLTAGGDPRLHLFETVVRQNAFDLQGHSGIVLRGLQMVNTLGPAVVDPQLSTSATLDHDWVYQNTPLATANRNKSVLTVQVVTADSYTVGVAKLFGSGNVTIQGTSNPLVWNILGGPASDGLAGTGSCVLRVTVTDLATAQVATADVTVTVRLLGAINNTGAVTTNDGDELWNRLNGLPTPDLTDRDLDLDGDGYVTCSDRVLLNRILNSLTVP